MIQNDIAVFIEVLQQGRIIAYPTESVFGLGCDPQNHFAVEQLLQLKQRSWKKGVILIASCYEQLREYVDETRLSQQQHERILATWPGAVTWVVPAKNKVPNWLTGERVTIAVRISAHPSVQLLCTAYGRAIVSTSANLAGSPPCKTYQQVKEQFGENFPILKGNIGELSNPTQIIDALTGQQLRKG